MQKIYVYNQLLKRNEKVLQMHVFQAGMLVLRWWVTTSALC